MIAISCLAAGALILAGAALLKARRTAKQIAELTASYWQLRYEHGQLASRLERLEFASGDERADGLASPAGTTTAFVPLSSLKR